MMSQMNEAEEKYMNMLQMYYITSRRIDLEIAHERCPPEFHSVFVNRYALFIIFDMIFTIKYTP